MPLAENADDAALAESLSSLAATLSAFAQAVYETGAGGQIGRLPRRPEALRHGQAVEVADPRPVRADFAAQRKA